MKGIFCEYRQEKVNEKVGIDVLGRDTPVLNLAVIRKRHGT
jgi:hypothetical protein